MIQTTGTIVMGDGVTSYINPLLNVYHNNRAKGKPQVLAAQVAIMKTVNEQTFAEPVADVLVVEYSVDYLTFENAQLYLKSQLETAFPNVTFQIV